MKYYNIKYLHDRLKEAGITNYTGLNNFRYKWVKEKEKKGLLVCPRGGASMNTRLFTEKQIDDIIKCFAPGGIGKYDWRKNK